MVFKVLNFTKNTGIPEVITMAKNYKEYRNKMKELVELEREEEMERHRKEIKKLSGQERQNRGRAILDLKGRYEGKGIANDHIIKFVSKKGLPDSEISVGDLVRVSKRQPENPDNPTGTVVEMTGHSVTVGFSERPPKFIQSRGVRLDLYVNDITFQRMLDAIENLEKSEELIDVLMGERKPFFGEIGDLELLEDELNDSQKDAVESSLKAEDIFLIHGPPGTGKTTTLAEVVDQHIEKGDRVLVTADSNTATDNMVEFLSKRGRNVLRIGHPARVNKNLRSYSLDEKIKEKTKYRDSEKLRGKAFELDEEQDKHTFPSGRNRRGLGNKAIKDLAEKGKGSRGIHPKKIESMAKWIKLQDKKDRLFEKAERLEEEAVQELIEEADVICTTNSTAGSEVIEGVDFDVVCIDEATQSTEPSCLIPITKAEKVVMAGDHKQLPPTILNSEAKDRGLEKTLFERMIEVHGEKIKKTLRVQYRMNTDIMGFSNKEFYENELEAHEKVANHQLNLNKDGEIEKVIDPENPFTLVDTNGEFMEETREGSTSKRNRGESKLVEYIHKKLVSKGVEPEKIGVISPYSDQIDLLEERLGSTETEIKTVDGYQGREKDVIVISLVRSNTDDRIGFLGDHRRLNVALTRARKKIIVIGDFDTLGQEEIYGKMDEYVKNKGRKVVLKNNSDLKIQTI